MDFTLPDEAQQAAALAATILADAALDPPDSTATSEPVGGDRGACVDAASIDLDLWKALGSAGLLGLLSLDPDAGLDEREALVATAAVVGQIGRAVAPVPLASHAVALLALRHAVDAGGDQITADDSRSEVLRAGSDGELMLALGLHSDLAEPARLARIGARITLNGRIIDVRTALAADAFVLAATDEAGTEHLVLLTRGQIPDRAIEVSRTSDGSTRATIRLDGIDLPEHAVLGGAGGSQLIRALACALDCIHQSGVLDQAVRLTADYVSAREQFGRPIGSFQAVGQRLADGYIDARATRLAGWQAISMVADALCRGSLDDATERAVATAAFWAADAGHRVAQTTVHLHGGMGIDLDGRAQRYFLAAKLGEFGLGGATRWAIAAGAPRR